MKTNAIVRIILFSLTILVLIGILLAGLSFNWYMFDGDTFVSNGKDYLPVASDGLTAQGAADASQIRNVEIEWVSGSIVIKPDANSTQINIQETGFSNEKYQMVYSRIGDTLEIQYCEESMDFPSFGFSLNGNISKDLIITVPADWICDTLEIDAASASINISDMTIQKVDFDGASGACQFINCSVGAISMDTASGDVDFSGTLNVLDFNGASADCSIVVLNVPSKIDIDTASGDLELWLPEECGFSCSMDTMSGRFSSDFSSTMQNGHHVYGDGSCIIQVDAMSGDVCIRKLGSDSAAKAVPDETIPFCTDPTCNDLSHDHMHFVSTTKCINDNCTETSHEHENSHSDSNHH